MKFRGIFLSAFAKAEKDTAASVKTQWARHIASELLEDYKYPVTEKTLRNYYDSYLYAEKEPGTQPKPDLVEVLCKYIGYDSYAHYAAEQERKEELKVIEEPQHLNKYRYWIIAVMFVIALSAAFVYSNSQETCMIWVVDHYEITECNGEIGVVRLDQETLDEMKQLFGLCNKTTFFLPNDEPAVWYDKYHNELTYFTTPGVHPTNGRTLKPITQYIIDKHVQECE